MQKKQYLKYSKFVKKGQRITSKWRK